MTTRIYLMVAIMAAVAFGQSKGPIFTGADYFPSVDDSGAVWYHDIPTKRGEASGYYRFKIDARSGAVPRITITKTSYFNFSSIGYVRNGYYFPPQSEGDVLWYATSQTSVFVQTWDIQFSTLKQILLSAMEVGGEWRFTDESTTSYPAPIVQYQLEKHLETLVLPNGKKIVDVLKVRHGTITRSGAYISDYYIYYGRGLGAVGTQSLDGTWLDYRRRDSSESHL